MTKKHINNHLRNLFIGYLIVLLFFINIFSVLSAQQTHRLNVIDASELPKDIEVSELSLYKLLIITPDCFERQLQPLVDHKSSVNVPTYIATLSEVYNQMNEYGRDSAEKIKYFIKEAVESWGVEYVLLVGGKKGQFSQWYCPVRYVYTADDWDLCFISDLYFADLYDSQGNFSTWDSDGDGIFGEWDGLTAEDVDIDLIPDVAVGRLPCRYPFEVRVMVQKIITYETTTQGLERFQTMLAVAGDTYPEMHNENWTGAEGEYYANLALENMTDFLPTRLFTSDGSFSDKSDVISTFSSGYGFVYFVGHGSPKSWGNNKYNSSEYIRGLTTTDMHKLQNNRLFPICVVSGCHNSQFDVSVFKWFNSVTRWRQEYVYECWGWRMTRKIGGGSIATLGCSALGYTKEDKDSFTGGINELEVLFFHHYGQNNVEVVGDTWKAAITSYIQKYPINWSTPALEDSWIDVKVVESWVLFGDPSLQIGGITK